MDPLRDERLQDDFARSGLHPERSYFFLAGVALLLFLGALVRLAGRERIHAPDLVMLGLLPVAVGLTVKGARVRASARREDAQDARPEDARREGDESGA